MTQATSTVSALESFLDFGIFDWIEWDKSPANEIFENRLKMLEYADQNNYFCYHLAEHHITPLSVSPSPSVFLSAAFQRTERLRLGPLVYLLPFYNPIRLIHEIGMLDNLSNGRLELGVGRGISPVEAEKFDLDPEELWDRFHEEMSILLTAFTKDRLDHEGKFHSYTDIELWIHPLQKPYPPLWYASNNLETVPWIARHGFNTSHVFADNATTKTHFDLYKQVWSGQKERDGMNHHVELPKLGLTRHIYVAPTDEQAVEECRSAFGTWFNNINFLWAKAGFDFLDFMRNYDALAGQEVVIAGSPDTVREAVQRAVDETGINYFCSIFAWGDLTPQQVMSSMRLFTEEIMPGLRPYGSA